MVAFFSSAALSATALWIVCRQWKRGLASSQFVVRILPAAALFVVLPVPAGAWRMLRGFQHIAEAGAGGVREAAALSLDVLRPLREGSIAFAIVVMAGAILQWRATTRAPVTPAPAQGMLLQTTRSSSGRLVVSALLLVPAGVLAYMAAGTVKHVMTHATMLTQAPVPQIPTPAAETGAGAAAVANRLLIAFAGGTMFSALLFVLTIANLWLARWWLVPRGATLAIWGLSAASVIAAIAFGVTLHSDVRALERLLR